DVTVLSGSREKEKDAARLGAKRFVATREPGALEALEGTCDLILDTVSAPHDLNKQLTLLRNFGTMVADVELIQAKQINDAYARMERGDVRYRFVIDGASFAA